MAAAAVVDLAAAAVADSVVGAVVALVAAVVVVADSAAVAVADSDVTVRPSHLPCTRQRVPNVARLAKFHSSQMERSQCSAATASRRIVATRVAVSNAALQAATSVANARSPRRKAQTPVLRSATNSLRS